MRKVNIKWSKFHQWMNVVAFGLLYSTMYIGRYNFNHALPEIVREFDLSAGVQSLLDSSVFLAYAVGCLVNGYFVDRYGAKKFIIIGCAGTVGANLSMSLAGSWQALLCISYLNGFVQSMVWIGGISVIVHWFRRDRRGIPIGIINMFSGFAYLIMLYASRLAIYLPLDNWRHSLVYPLFIICYFAVVFYAVFKEKPAEAGLPEYEEDDGEMAAHEAVLSTIPKGYGHALNFFLRRKLLLCWAAIAFLSSFCRYGMLAWVPVFYADASRGLFMGEQATNITLSTGMAIGTLVAAWVAGKHFYKNKGVVVAVAAALCGTLVVLFPNLGENLMVVGAIFFTGFLLFGINGVLWLYAMDEGGRRFAGTVTGILNGAAYVGAALQPYIFSFLTSIVSDWMFVFLLVEGLCVLMVVFGLLVCKRDTNIEKS